MPPHSVSLPPAFLFLSLLVFFLSFRLKNREGDTGCADTNQELSTDGNSNMTLIVSPGKQVSPSVGGTDNVASKSVAVWQKNSEEVIQNHGKIFISSCLQNMQSERWKFSPISGSLDWDGNLPVQLLNIKRSQIYPTVANNAIKCDLKIDTFLQKKLTISANKDHEEEGHLSTIDLTNNNNNHLLIQDVLCIKSYLQQLQKVLECQKQNELSSADIHSVVSFCGFHSSLILHTLEKQVLNCDHLFSEWMLSTEQKWFPK